MRKRNDHLSLSQAGHCRLELWFVHHKYEPEPKENHVLRNFEMGDLVENLLFEKFTVQTHEGSEEIGGWLSWAEPIVDQTVAFEWDPKLYQITHRQRVVGLPVGSDPTNQVLGHIDGIAEPLPEANAFGGFVPRFLVDAKSANRWSFQRAIVESLIDSPFGRELVFQQQMYLHALREEGDALNMSVLVYYDKEKSHLGCRVIPYNAGVVAEGLERLVTGMRDDAPEADWHWQSGEEIPLRCRYCDMKQQCSKLRGLPLKKVVNEKKGTEQWFVK